MGTARRSTRFIVILLLIEFIDELVGGAREAAWPLLRADFNLSYTQIGLMLSIPGIVSNVIEPFIGILGDTWKRHALILGGGCVFVISCFMAAASPNGGWLLAAYVLFYPASGAFVSLSQAELMDLEPDRHEQNMSRWAFVGSRGVILGPILVGAAALIGMSWRVPFGITAFAALAALVFSWPAFQRSPLSPRHTGQAGEISILRSLLAGFRGALQALKRGEVLRWLTLLSFSELMLSILYFYLALYLVDVGGLSPAAAGFGVAVWTIVGLVGDFLLIPLLERVPGIVYLRISAAVQLVLFPLFLLVQDILLKFVLLGLLGFFNSGWYSILKGRLYSAMPGQSGTVTTVGNIFGFAEQLIPLAIGLFAQRFGLGNAMWLLILGPIALLVGLPLREPAPKKKLA